MKYSKSTPLRIVLVSSSPRRRQFFRLLRIPFRTVAPDIPEAPSPGETGTHYACRVAKAKARAGLAKLRITSKSPARYILVSADTIVVRGQQFLPKPRDPCEAAKMLRQLSGRSHHVITGVCVLEAYRGKIIREKVFYSDTTVWFKRLRAEEIAAYVKSGEPMDKAGAYGIQGLGCFLVRKIVGSYTNVVGLPLAELLECLERDFGLKIIVPARFRTTKSRD